MNAPEPFDTGRLDVGDGHSLYWEVCGNPQGAPAVVLHGGPGSGCTPWLRRWFDPTIYRVVLFDQRNCGRSTPHAGAPEIDLATNTTADLIADIERIREHLGVRRWLVAGVSWGTTLALAYAEEHPQHVSAMVLNSVVTTTRAEVEWVTRAMGRVFPEQWEQFRLGAGASADDIDLAAAYSRLLHDADPHVRDRAAAAWCAWEDTHVATVPGYRPNPRYQDPSFRLCFARLVTHYWTNAAFLADGQLMGNVDRLRDTPAVMIHGRLDVSGPADIPWQLHRRWPASELVLLDGVGHGVRLDAVRAATDRLSPAELA